GVLWTQTWDFNGNCGAEFPSRAEHYVGIAADESRGAYCAGWWQGDAQCHFETEISIIRYTTGGRFIDNTDPCCPDWRPYNGMRARAITRDHDGNVIVVGKAHDYFTETTRGSYVVKWNPEMDRILFEKANNDTGEEFYGAAVDSANNVVAVGQTQLLGGSP